MPYQHFSIEEREKIQYGLWDKQSVREIARTIRRSPSSVSREINRNIPWNQRRYTPRLAHERAEENCHHRGRIERLKNGTIRSYVREQLREGYSPEQIAGRLPTAHPGHGISPEAIYQFVYAQFHRNGYGRLLGEDLRPYLKRRHKRRIPKGARRCQRISPPSKPSIEERPREVERRTVPGHWESDSLESFNHRAGLNTLVERKTGLVLITRLTAKTSAATAEVIIARLASVPEQLRRTITFDNGSENWKFREIHQAIGIEPYFAHAYCSWERGTNENTNGLIRWYFPKRTDFRTISDEEIQRVEYLLNTRPRKRLGWKTPLEVFDDSVALTC
jgi:IS30 family transposase